MKWTLFLPLLWDGGGKLWLGPYVGNDEEVVMEQGLQRRALGTKQECSDREGGCKLAAARSVAAM